MTRSRSRLLPRLAMAGALLGVAGPVVALFHEIKIDQVFGGTAASPNAQYVMLRMYTANQNFVNGHALTVFDATGALVDTFTFSSDVANGASQDTLLLATSQAATLFNVTPDLVISPVSLAGGGKICWAGTFDCVALGAYGGSPSGVGVPFRMANFGGLALTRRTDICGGAGTLDICDDTDNSSTDFILALPAPYNNARQSGTLPASTCGNNTLEGLEDCDDGDTISGDGCSSLCFREPSEAVPQALAVDTNTNASDGNGMLEPGETVSVVPSWKNTDSAPHPLSGGATAFRGPAGAAYAIKIGLAVYGTLSAGATQNCQLGSGFCYQLALSAPLVRPAAHWDAAVDEVVSRGGRTTWRLHVGDSFSDVPRAHPFYTKIETLFHNGVTSGCAAGAYCPTAAVPRDQMAIFLGKGIAGSGSAIPDSGTVGASSYDCSAGGASLFSDVAPTDVFCRHVHYLAAQNVTSGCGSGLYCPAESVTRLQMAGFVARAIVAPAGGAGVPETYGPDPVTGLSYSCSAGSPNVHFSDVPASEAFCKHVHFLWAKGIIAGCSASEYCPGTTVSRDQMAKFLANAFALPLYGP